MTRFGAIWLPLATIAAVLLVGVPTASAEGARNAEPVVGMAGVDLSEFSDQVSRAAAAAGVPAPDAAAIREAFAKADTNGDGLIDTTESQAKTGPRCTDRGVCVLGRCFCVESETSGKGEAAR